MRTTQTTGTFCFTNPTKTGSIQFFSLFYIASAAQTAADSQTVLGSSVMRCTVFWWYCVTMCALTALSIAMSHDEHLRHISAVLAMQSIALLDCHLQQPKKTATACS